MTGLGNLIRRNSKLFFKDKAMFFTSLITPIILLILYTTFLGNVYKQSFLSAIPTGFELSEKLINAVVAGQLVSSLLAVCCVTVSFCSNMLMVQDKVSGARADLTVTPVKKSTLAVSYYISTLISTHLQYVLRLQLFVLFICQILAGIFHLKRRFYSCSM